MKLKAVIISFTLLSLTSCKSSSPTINIPHSLVGEWKIEKVEDTPALNESNIMISFREDGRYHGDNGCNSFFGRYRLNGDLLILSPSGSTMMACEPKIMEQEHKITQLMLNVTKANRDDELLTLSNSNKQSLLTLVKI